MAPAQQAERLEDLPHDTRHRGLAGPRIALKHIMTGGQVRPAAMALHRQGVGQGADRGLDRGETDHRIQWPQHLVEFRHRLEPEKLAPSGQGGKVFPGDHAPRSCLLNDRVDQILDLAGIAEAFVVLGAVPAGEGLG